MTDRELVRHAYPPVELDGLLADEASGLPDLDLGRGYGSMARWRVSRS